MESNAIISRTAHELNVPADKAAAVIELFSEGATIPFIARYRKEATGSMDEVMIQKIRDRYQELEELEKRREAILKSLKERELLTDDLLEKITTAETINELEDVYLPFKPKRRTKATIAREKGLEPLAALIYEQTNDPIDLSPFINPDNDVNSEEDAINGAKDIIAEWINEDADIRKQMRELFREYALIQSRAVKKKAEEAVKYRDYHDWQEPLKSTASHRILAILRGQKEGLLTVHALPDENKALVAMENMILKGEGESGTVVFEAIHDAYKRLLAPSLENEILSSYKQEADKEAIEVFAKNLRELLLSPPFGQKRVLAIDPGFRTGCKVVALDAQGNLMVNATIFPLGSKKQKGEAEALVKAMCENNQIEVIAVGNGTGGRETEEFLRSPELDIPVTMVDESGASIYSASEIGREEFPDHDITVRGAVSIGRRLQDPLAELVKIDPKSIGVGQYQHDVDQSLLKKSLDDTVMSCVNAVGVELNTASVKLLSYVSGLGPQLAKNIVEYRKENGPFKNRQEILKVPRLGAKAFEQAAGFLRIQDGENPLDSSAVHPERYALVEKMADALNCAVKDLMQNSKLREEINLENYISDEVGLPTLRDILEELSKPGRDPRPEFEPFSFSSEVREIGDLKPGMVLPGIITNVTNFGAFVDIGVHNDGLIHKSQFGDRYVPDPSEIVRVRQKVKVKVLDIDIERGRIGLALIE